MAGQQTKRVRRAFATMNVGHLSPRRPPTLEWCESQENPELFMINEFDRLIRIKYPDNVRAVALALEKGEKTGNWHIQAYVELKAGRSYAYYARLFSCMETAFSEVKDAAGSWQYCTGTGKYEGKQGVHDRWEYGEPVLYGGKESRADLRKCVELIVDGNHPTYILKHYPYAYTVHRTRIWRLYVDLRELKNKGVLSPINKV